MHKIGLLGSCVTREPLKLIDDKISISWYEARTSIPSMMSKPVWFPYSFGPDVPAFEQRNLMQDIGKSWFANLKRADFDVLIIDFIDERFGVMEYNESLFTWSSAFKSVSLDQTIKASMKYHSPTSQAYRDHVKDKLDLFLDELRGFDRKIICNNVFWVFRNEIGEHLDQFPEDRFSAANDVLRIIYDGLKSVPGILFVDISPESLVADSLHKWGAAPFHFSPENDRHIAHRILELIDV